MIESNWLDRLTGLAARSLPPPPSPGTAGVNLLQRLNQISGSIIGAAIEVHRNLGPGLLESTYEVCLAYELESMGLVAKRQKPLPVVYGDIRLEAGYRVDLLVEGLLSR